MEPETIRYLLIGVAFLVLGFNASLLYHTARIVRAVLAWRLFVLGKSGLTVYVIVSLWHYRHDSITWRIPLAATALALTLLGVALLELNHHHEERT
jgi:hypothetical protein